MNYPGNLIKQGSKGDDVKAIQQQLIDTGFGPLQLMATMGQER